MTELRRTHDPAEMYSLRRIAVASLLLPVAVGVLAVLVTHPLAVVAAAFVAGSVQRTVRYARTRRRAERTQRVCVPATGTCVEV